MSAAAEPQPLRCPACRARQPLQSSCRRCGADLRLLAAALARADYLAAERQAARQAGDAQRLRRIEQELRLLTPTRLRADSP